jgi:hypothetical protein
MLVAQARAVARRWVLDDASAAPAFAGAFFVGSATALAPAATLPPTSDVDVRVVVDVPDPPDKIGKFAHDGVLLDVSYVSADRLRSPDQVLGDYLLAGDMRWSELIADPTGQLAATRAVVAERFARRAWVRRRCAHARDGVLHRLRGLRDSDPLSDQVISWVFPTGAVTYVLLVAGLRNPTVRRRYVVVRELLAEHGRVDLYETLLELLGCQRMTPRRVEHHLAALAHAFDAASAVADAPFIFASDISRAARPIAIDGSRELIRQGDHREAVFWMVATYAKCQKILAHGAAPTTRDACEVGLRELIGDLGIASVADLEERRRRVEDVLPRVCDVAEAIITGTSRDA